MNQPCTLSIRMLSHMALKEEHHLIHEIKVATTVQSGHDGILFYRLIVTPKISEFEFGESKTLYYWQPDDDQAFDTIKEILASKNLFVFTEAHKSKP